MAAFDSSEDGVATFFFFGTKDALQIGHLLLLLSSQGLMHSVW